MLNYKLLSVARHRAFSAGLLATLMGVYTVAAQSESAPVEEVVVTGSRIPQSANSASVSPIQTMSEEELKARGITDVSDALNTLPQVFQNAANDFSNTSNSLASPGGFTTANLRGLGPQRTLVMIDGRRLGPGDSNTGNPNPGPDLDQIPVALISSIDVITGGASAVYGSDALAGAVNFKLKRDFDGIQLDGNTSVFQHHNHNDFMQGLIRDSGEQPPSSTVWDGHTQALSLALGKTFADGRANISLYAGYRKSDPVYQSSRDFSACEYARGDQVNPISASNGDPTCNGSPNSNIYMPAVEGNFYTVAGNQFLSWPQAGTSPPAAYNANTLSSLQRENERTTYGGFFHFDVNDAFKPYVEVMAMRDRSRNFVAPTALFFGANPYSDAGEVLVNCDNPLLSAQQRSIVCSSANGVTDTVAGDAAMYVGRRNIEGGSRYSTYLHKNVRSVFGAKGDLGSAWSYDVYAQFYTTHDQQDDRGYFSWTRINRALQAVDVNGVATCKSVVDGTDPSCVPYNIFSEGGVSQAQLNYLGASSTQHGEIHQNIASTNIVGDLGKYGIKMPLASDGVGVAVGAEYRYESVRYTPDANALSNDLAGYSGQATSIDGSYHVREIFGETRVPFIQNQPGVDNLSGEAAFRYSDYSNFGGVDTYKLGIRYAPIRDLSLRGSYQRAIRAPNIIELFTPNSVTNTNEFSDPCAGASPTASATECAHTGVTSNQYGNITPCFSSQCSVSQGGNADLKPEKSDTVSFGFTFQPRALEGFAGSLDYYRITLKDTIGVTPLNFTLNQCLASGDPFYCSFIKRNSAGTLFGSTVAGGGYIMQNNANVGESVVAGVDLQAAYRWSVGSLGTMSASLVGAYLLHASSAAAPGEHTYDCVGLYGVTCQNLYPRWRHTLRLSWMMPANVSVSLNWRYIGSVKLETNTSDATLSNGEYDPYNAELGAIHYFDLSGNWDITDGISIRAGINNLFDRDPPLVNAAIAGIGSPNAFPSYDLLGRQLFAGFTAKFH